MPYLDSPVLLHAYNSSSYRAAGTAFVEHVLPQIDKKNVERRFLSLMEKGKPCIISILSYTETKFHKNTFSLEESSTDLSMSLLSTILGPEFYIFKSYFLDDRVGQLNVTLMLEFRPSIQNNTQHPLIPILWPNAADVTVRDGRVIWNKIDTELPLV